MRPRLYDLLTEALRRYARFHKGESLTEAWTGLGSARDYRNALQGGYMEWINGVGNPGYTYWLRLTEKGAKIVQAWLDKGFDYQDIETGARLPWPV